MHTILLALGLVAGCNHVGLGARAVGAETDDLISAARMSLIVLQEAVDSQLALIESDARKRVLDTGDSSSHVVSMRLSNALNVNDVESPGRLTSRAA